MSEKLNAVDKSKLIATGAFLGLSALAGVGAAIALQHGAETVTGWADASDHNERGNVYSDMASESYNAREYETGFKLSDRAIGELDQAIAGWDEVKSDVLIAGGSGIVTILAGTGAIMAADRRRELDG